MNCGKKKERFEALSEEKEKRAAELVVANKELVFQSEEKEKRAAELVVANKELVFQNEEKEKRAAELVVANKELVFQNEEKKKRAAELVVANRELEKSKSDINKLNKGLEQTVIERTVQFNTAKLEAERANLAKSEFLSRMSHELRTPLNAILGFGQLLEMDALTPRQSQGVAQILKGGRHLLAMINEVLDITRIESEHMSLYPEPVAVGEAVQEALDLMQPLAAPRHIQLQESLAPFAQWHVQVDRQRLKQVLLNLLSNAIKYNRDDGKVIVDCGLQIAETDSQSSFRNPQPTIRISITDTGPGIAPAMLEHLFIPFDRLGAEQSGIEGTGLGLALSKRLVELMGRKRWGVESRGRCGEHLLGGIADRRKPGAAIDTIGARHAQRAAGDQASKNGALRGGKSLQPATGRANPGAAVGDQTHHHRARTTGARPGARASPRPGAARF